MILMQYIMPRFGSSSVAVVCPKLGGGRIPVPLRVYALPSNPLGVLYLPADGESRNHLTVLARSLRLASASTVSCSISVNIFQYNYIILYIILLSYYIINIHMVYLYSINASVNESYDDAM